MVRGSLPEVWNSLRDSAKGRKAVFNELETLQIQDVQLPSLAAQPTTEKRIWRLDQSGSREMGQGRQDRLDTIVTDTWKK